MNDKMQSHGQNAAAASQAVGWFQEDSADGSTRPHYSQVSQEYEGTPGTFPLFHAAALASPAAQAQPVALTDDQRRACMRAYEAHGLNPDELMRAMLGAAPEALAPDAALYDDALGRACAQGHAMGGPGFAASAHPVAPALAPDAEVARLVAALRNMKANDFPPSAPWTRGDCKIVAEAADLIERLAAHPVAGGVHPDSAVAVWVLRAAQAWAEGPFANPLPGACINLRNAVTAYNLAAPPAKAEPSDFEDLHMRLMQQHGELLAKYQALKARTSEALIAEIDGAITVYPAVTGSPGSYRKRTAWEDGWNACGDVVTEICERFGIPARVDSEGA